MTFAEKMRYNVCIGAKSPVRVWRPETTTARMRCQYTPLFFRDHAPLILAGCMGRSSSDLPVPVVAGSPTPCNPLSVFGETEPGYLKTSHYGENHV